MTKNVTVRTFNPEESVPVFKNPTMTNFVGEDDDYPQTVGYSYAEYLNGANYRHKVGCIKKRY